MAYFDSFFERKLLYAGLQHFFSYEGLVHITLYNESRGKYIVCLGEQYILSWDEVLLINFSGFASVGVVLVGLNLKREDHDNRSNFSDELFVGKGVYEFLKNNLS